MSLLIFSGLTQVFCFSFDSKEKRTPFPVIFLFYDISNLIWCRDRYFLAGSRVSSLLRASQ